LQLCLVDAGIPRMSTGFRRHDVRNLAGMAKTRLIAGVLVAVLAAPAGAHHKQTPPVVPFVTPGDTPLPRLASQNETTFTLAVPSGSGTQIVAISPYIAPTVQLPQGNPGNNANPAIASQGKMVVWDTADDPLGLGLPGRQLVMSQRGSLTLTALTKDPTGTSSNPAVDVLGRNIAFESTGDLANTGNAGARQIFLLQQGGSIQQLSSGAGTSRNPTISALRPLIAFESTSDPTTGADTGISQIWLGGLPGPKPTRLTHGAGPSFNPALSDDGGLLAFESTADLAGTGADTGVSQVFIYHPKSNNFARITEDAGGCHLPGVSSVFKDFRVTFVCSGEAYFYMMAADLRFHVQIGGVTQRVLGEMGVHFIMVGSTGNPFSGGTTPANQVYLINLFKRPAQQVGGLATWFPARGVPHAPRGCAPGVC
jgi:WD40-like Beta Propeller Repeat